MGTTLIHFLESMKNNSPDGWEKSHLMSYTLTLKSIFKLGFLLIQRI